MRYRLIVACALVLGGCYQTSDTSVQGPQTPDSTALEAVVMPPDAWTSQGACITDFDCEDKADDCQRSICQQGRCEAVPQRAGLRCNLSSDQLGECQVGACVVRSGVATCEASPAQDGVACGAYYAACEAASICVSGQCKDPCTKGGSCSTGQCTPQGCVYTPIPDATCDDGDSCTANDSCQDGVCVGTPVCECTRDADCQDPSQASLCDGTYICKNNTCQLKAGTLVDCSATGFEPCETAQCNPATGKCELVQAATGTTCNDGNDCTTGDMCEAGRCTQFEDVVCEWNCTDDKDEDDDGKADCDDFECIGTQECPGVCGDEYCTGSELCGTCPQDCGACPPACGDAVCNGDETCLTCLQDCPADCTGKECGDDLCGGSCGTCPGVQDECIASECVCQPLCDGLECGDDGCGGDCGTCPGPQDACQSGTCVCQPACENRMCGDDGCGSVCGTCAATEDCVEGHCMVQPGALCNSADECLSGFCVDGVCCDTACAGLCQACNVPGMTGTCGPVQLGMDPANECNPGACNGSGACQDATGTACTQNGSCVSGFCVDGVCCDTICNGLCAQCNGTTVGMCSNIPLGDDPHFECPGATACNGTGGCNFFPNGNACTFGSECASGFCVDGVCCNTACAGTCQACNIAGMVGACGNIPLGQDPANECAGAQACDGTGMCKLPLSEACALGADCISGFCVDGYCCDNACNGLCKTCKGSLPGMCSNINLGTDPDNECSGATTCNGMGMCSLFANGSPCSSSGECMSGFCVDGVCCNTGCNGLCQTCSVAGSVGTCSNIPSGQDPANECAGTQTCNGSGACAAAAPTFSLDVSPILVKYCISCHPTGTFTTSYADSQSASAACPAKTKGECSLIRIKSGSMPSGKGCTGNPAVDVGNANCLTAAEQAVLQAWVDGGQLP